MQKLFDVSGKVAVITGGSRGLGRMIAHGLVANGVRTYITARKESELQQTAAELSQYGECIPIVANLATNAGVTALATELAEREPAIHILCNNAGAAWGEDIHSFPEQGWDKVMDLNVKSLFFLTQQLLPQLRADATPEDPGRVINIASINGITHPHMQNYSYSASKAAVIQLTRHMAADLAREWVNVNAIAPGFFPSQMTHHIVQADDAADFVDRGIPRGRFGSPEDAAGTVIYLCSRAGAWVCGHTLVLDGGAVAAAG